MPYDELYLYAYGVNLQIVEAKCTVHACIKLPPSLGPPPKVEDWGKLPSLEQLGLCSHNVGVAMITCTCPLNIWLLQEI